MIDDIIDTPYGSLRVVESGSVGCIQVEIMRGGANGYARIPLAAREAVDVAHSLLKYANKQLGYTTAAKTIAAVQEAITEQRLRYNRMRLLLDKIEAAITQGVRDAAHGRDTPEGQSIQGEDERRDTD